jgi:hypothetical protein
MMIWVKEKNWFNTDIGSASFISPKSMFITNPARGMNYVQTNIIKYLGTIKHVINQECIYEYCLDLTNVKNASLLVIGGGPSTNSTPIDYHKYDYIISCNHFFLNKTLNNLPIDIMFLGDEVNLSHPLLCQYLTKFVKAKICFENIGRSPIDLMKFKNAYKDRTIWAHTRYHSKIGSITRIVSYLCNLNPRSIDIVGMDGYIPQSLNKDFTHAFEAAKQQSGSIESNSQNDSIILNKYYDQYLEFWDYVLHDIGSEIVFKNLGHTHPCNISTKVLTDKLGPNYCEYLTTKRRN